MTILGVSINHATAAAAMFGRLKSAMHHVKPACRHTPSRRDMSDMVTEAIGVS